MTSIPKTSTFLHTLKTQLGPGSLTPAQADQIRKAAQILEGGTGITESHIAQVGKELKLTTGQKAALRFSFLLDRLAPQLGSDWKKSAHGTADALRAIAQKVKNEPKTEKAVTAFIASLHGQDMTGLSLHGNLRGIEREGDAFWLTASASGPRKSYTDVSLVARGGKATLAFAEGALVVELAHGRGVRQVRVTDLDDQSKNDVADALLSTVPKSAVERAFVAKANAALSAPSQPRAAMPMPGPGGQTMLAAAPWKSIPKFDGARLKSPPAPKKIAHGDDAGAFLKRTGGFVLAPAEKGKLGTPVPLDRVSVETLLRAKAVVESRLTGAAALELSDEDIDTDAVELDSALALSIASRKKAERMAYTAAEERLRKALQGLPGTSLDREVFLSLVGAVAGKGA